MCGLCGVLGAEAHWTDASGLEGPSGGPPRGNRRQERLYRVALANKVLTHYGLTLTDWGGNDYVLGSRTGRSEIVHHLTALWPAAERMAGRRCDPLDPVLIAAIERE
jgi:hypothetical protein